MIKNVSFFKPGVKFFAVHVLAKNSHILECVLKEIYFNKITAWAKCKKVVLEKYEFTLTDFNIPTLNGYNHHRLFRTLIEAQKYKNFCRRNKIQWCGSYNYELMSFLDEFGYGDYDDYDDLQETVDE
jgi:hypothetical protein